MRESNPHTRNETPESLPLDEHDEKDFHFGCAPARALPSEAASRCTRSGFLPRTSRAAYTLRLCDDGVRRHTRSGKTKRPGSFAESGPLEFRVRLACQSDTTASRIGAILGRAVIGHLPHRQVARTRQGAHERMQAGEGLGVAMGVPAVHDGRPGFSSVRSARSEPARCVQKIVALPSDRTQCK